MVISNKHLHEITKIKKSNDQSLWSMVVQIIMSINVLKFRQTRLFATNRYLNTNSATDVF